MAPRTDITSASVLISPRVKEIRVQVPVCASFVRPRREVLRAYSLVRVCLCAHIYARCAPRVHKKFLCAHIYASPHSVLPR